MDAKQRCEGWRRYGGVFSLGPVTWVQCQSEGDVLLTIRENGVERTLPACKTCWQECIDTHIDIIRVVPIVDKSGDV